MNKLINNRVHNKKVDRGEAIWNFKAFKKLAKKAKVKSYRLCVGQLINNRVHYERVDKREAIWSFKAFKKLSKE